LQIKEHCIDFLLRVLNLNNVPDYMRESKLILLRKPDEASLNDARPITVANHLTKIVEKANK
jgi:hypothetical protein